VNKIMYARFFSRRELENADKSYTNFDYDWNITAKDIQDFFYKRTDSNVSCFEFGVGDWRLDLIRVDCHKKLIRAFEFKVNIQDFKNDNKWHNYLNYCNTLTFISPYGMIIKEDLPKEVGLMYVFKFNRKNVKWENGYGLGALWERKPRIRPLDKDVYVKIITQLLLRAKYSDYVVHKIF